MRFKEGFVPRKAKVFPLTPDEQNEVNGFLDSKLKKGYICPSKSPQTSSIFFEPKKEAAKRIVQDY